MKDRFLEFAERHPRVAIPVIVGYLIANRLTGVGRPRPAEQDLQYRPLYASAMFSLPQHRAWSLWAERTLCGALTDRISTGPIRTLLGIDCWRCKMIQRRNTNQKETAP